MEYYECKVLCNLKRKSKPLTKKVPIDEYTNVAEKNFDYEFDGVARFYPFELPKEIFGMDFKTLVIVGGSGKGKSTLLKEFFGYRMMDNKYNNSESIISNFAKVGHTPDEASKILASVGLNDIPVWVKTRNVLSVGEGFRADIALNLQSYTIFDEFTSVVDRKVAMGSSKGIARYIEKNGLHHVVFCSCHSDYIPFLNPDIVIDLDYEKVFDCRGIELKKVSVYPSTSSMGQTVNSQKRKYGTFLKNITI